MPSERRREAILDAVGAEVVEREMDLTTKELAQLAGVAEGTLFRVFGSKEELLVAAFAHRLEQVARDDSWKRDLVRVDGKDLEAQLERYIEVVTERIVDWTRLMSILHRFLRGAEASKAHSLREASHGEVRRIKDLYIGTLKDFADSCAAILAPHAGQLRVGVDQAVAFIQSTATSLAMARQFHDFGITPAMAADLVVHGLVDANPTSADGGTSTSAEPRA